jgi:hypothetical protein
MGLGQNGGSFSFFFFFFFFLKKKIWNIVKAILIINTEHIYMIVIYQD